MQINIASLPLDRARLKSTRWYSNYSLREVLISVSACEALTKMPPWATRRTTSTNAHDGSTVRQTIVKTLEAPRLIDIASADFVAFKQKRTICERRVQEKSVKQRIEIPTTSY